METDRVGSLLWVISSLWKANFGSLSYNVYVCLYTYAQTCTSKT